MTFEKLFRVATYLCLLANELVDEPEAWALKRTLRDLDSVVWGQFSEDEKKVYDLFMKERHARIVDVAKGRA